MLALWQEKEAKGPAMRLTHPHKGSLQSWVTHLPFEGGRRGEMGEELPEETFLIVKDRGSGILTGTGLET